MLNAGGIETAHQAYAVVQALCYSMKLADNYVDFLYSKFDLDDKDIFTDLYNVLADLTVKYKLCPRSVGISFTHDNRFRPQWADFDMGKRLKVPLDVPIKYPISYCPGKLSPIVRVRSCGSFRLGIEQLKAAKARGEPPCLYDDEYCAWMRDVLEFDSPCNCVFIDGTSAVYSVFEQIAEVSEVKVVEDYDKLLDDCFDIVFDSGVLHNFERKFNLSEKCSVDYIPFALAEDFDYSEIYVSSSSSDDAGSFPVFGIEASFEDRLMCELLDGGNRNKGRRKEGVMGDKTDNRVSKARQKVLDARKLRKAEKKKNGGIVSVKRDIEPKVSMLESEYVIKEELQHPVVIPVLGQWNFLYVDTSGGGETTGFELIPGSDLSVYVPDLKKFLPYRSYLLTHNLFPNFMEVYVSRTIFFDYPALLLKFLSQFSIETVLGRNVPPNYGYYAGRCKCDFLHRFCASDCFYVPQGPIDFDIMGVYKKIRNSGDRRVTDKQLTELLVLSKIINVRMSYVLPGVEVNFNVVRDRFFDFFFEIFQYEPDSTYWLDLLDTYRVRPIDYERVFSAWLFILIIWEFGRSVMFRDNWTLEQFSGFIFRSYEKLNKFSAFRIPYLDVSWMLGGGVV